MPVEWFRSIHGICFDIDDTFSSHGQIRPEAFSALWSLRDAGFLLIPVTGRPAGWCDHIARFWPVHAVVGENGAFVMAFHGGKLHRVETLGEKKSLAARKKIHKLWPIVKKKFPKAHQASDQSYRNYDLAIDIGEDVKRWTDKEIDRLIDVCEKTGAHAKLSSIHVNAWYGDYTKWDGLQCCIKKVLPKILPKILKSAGKSTELPLENLIYAGDSPNDEPLFQRFEKSVGVANLKNYLSRLKFPPTVMTENESGQGFAELAQKLLQARSLSS